MSANDGGRVTTGLAAGGGIVTSLARCFGAMPLSY